MEIGARSAVLPAALFFCGEVETEWGRARLCECQSPKGFRVPALWNLIPDVFKSKAVRHPKPFWLDSLN